MSSSWVRFSRTDSFPLKFRALHLRVCRFLNEKCGQTACETSVWIILLFSSVAFFRCVKVKAGVLGPANVKVQLSSGRCSAKSLLDTDDGRRGPTELKDYPIPKGYKCSQTSRIGLPYLMNCVEHFKAGIKLCHTIMTYHTYSPDTFLLETHTQGKLTSFINYNLKEL